jgi:uncharacterized membrane protein
MHSSTPPTLAGPYLGLASQPVYATLVQFPAVCFVGTLLTDIAYWKTTNYIWETFSIWLLTIGCIVAAFAGIAGLITWFRYRHVRVLPFAGLHVITSVVALILLMLLATWFGWPRPRYTTDEGAVR